MIKSAKRAAAIAVLAAATTVAVPVGAASAATTGHHSTVIPNTYGTFNTSVWADGIYIRSSPGTGTVLGEAFTGQTLTDYCYTTSTSVNNNPYWDKITDQSTGVTGYITEYYLNNQSQTKHC